MGEINTCIQIDQKNSLTMFGLNNTFRLNYFLKKLKSHEIY